MPRRTESWPDKTKERIRAGVILDRLIKHTMGEIEMTTTQIQAAKIVLNKVLPDLKAVENTGTQEIINYVVNAAPDLAPEAWKDKHAPSGDRSQGHKPH